MKWTEAENELIRTLYPTTPPAKMAEMLGRSVHAVTEHARLMGVRQAVKRPNWFPIGTERWDNRHKAMNRKVADTGDQSKDWKNVCVIEWEAINGPVPEGMCLAVRAKRLPRTLENLVLVKIGDQVKLVGRDPYPLGHERVHYDGHLYRKISMEPLAKEKAWKRVEILEWEKLHGPIPEDHFLGLKDHSKPRTMDNLAVYSRTEHMERLGIKGVPAFPKEVRELLHIKAAITKQVKKIAKAQAPR